MWPIFPPIGYHWITLGGILWTFLSLLTTNKDLVTYNSSEQYFRCMVHDKMLKTQQYCSLSLLCSVVVYWFVFISRSLKGKETQLQRECLACTWLTLFYCVSVLTTRVQKYLLCVCVTNLAESGSDMASPLRTILNSQDKV